MRSDAGVTGSADQTFAALDSNMLASFKVPVALGKSKIDDIHSLFVIAAACHKIVSLDISMHEAFAMDLFQPCYNLHADLQRSGQRKVFLATWRWGSQIWNKSSSDSYSKSIIIKMRSFSKSDP